jgi:thiamine kinase-like enzyme
MILTGYNGFNYLRDNCPNESIYAELIRHNWDIIENAPTRNMTFRVGNYFIKQAKFREESYLNTIRAEAEAYFFFSHLNDVVLKNQLPELVSWDDKSVILITKFIKEETYIKNMFFNAKRFETIQMGSFEFAKLITKKLGGLLLDLKNNLTIANLKTSASENNKEFNTIQRHIKPLWIDLSMMQVEDYSNSNYLNGTWRKIGAFLKEDKVKGTLDSLRKRWCFDYLINGDVKFDNFMFDSEELNNTYLVDWEMVGLGDCHWDLASLIKEYWIQYPWSPINTNKKELTKILLEIYLEKSITQHDKVVDYIIRLAGVSLLDSVSTKDNNNSADEINRWIGICKEMLLNPTKFYL